MKFDKYGIIFELLATACMLTSYILVLIQSFNNYNFKCYKTKDLIIERLSYEQFFQEVDSNINAFTFTKDYNETFNHWNNHDDMHLEIKTETYYDCRGVYDEELNEENCQNKIISNSTCCRPECCIRTNGNKLICTDYKFNFSYMPQNNKIFLYNDDEFFEDPKRRFCTYYNNYKIDIEQNQFTNAPKLYKFRYNYKQILNGSNYISNLMCIGKTKCNDEYSDCGIIDTKGNHLYIRNYSFCPITEIIYNRDENSYDFKNNSNQQYYNSDKIIVRNIISEIPPNTHEWKGVYNNSDTQKELSNINVKDIDNTDNNIYQEKLTNINIDNIISYYDNKINTINTKQKINWYTTNYIGFGSKDDLNKFYDFFSKNKLYKIGSDLYPSLESIIIGFFLIVLCIAYIILFFLAVLKE